MRILRLRPLLAVAALLALPASAHAQAPRWTPLGPFGGQVDSITADPAHPGTLYATTPVGVYKTADAGGSWTALYLHPLILGRVAVDPLHPSTLYLTGAFPAAPVLKSVDGGAHWSPAAGGLPLYYPLILEMDPARPRRLYVGSNGLGLWRSEDAGASWQPASDGLPGGQHAIVLALSAASRPAGKVFAATARGVYQSADGGLSWSAAPGLPRSLAGAVAFAPSDPRTAYASVQGSGLYRTTDGGDSWRRVLKAELAATGISVSPRSPRLLYALFGKGALFRSTDGGEHWVQIQAKLPVTAVAADPFFADTVYSGIRPGTSPGGVWRSGNQGKSWVSRSQGLTAIATTSLAIDPDDPERLWTSTLLGPYRSGNGGARWSRVPMPPGESGVAQVAAGGGSRIFALTWKSSSSLDTPPSYSLWRTDDDGASWTRLPAPSSSVLLLRVAAATLYAVEALPADPLSPFTRVRRVLRSTDAGAHWESWPQTTLSCGLGDLAAASSDPRIIYLGGCKAPRVSAVLRSDDGGATFSDVSEGLPGTHVQALALDPRDPNTLWAGTAEDGVWKSVNGGGAWTRAGAETAGLTITALLAPDTPGRVYAASLDGRVFRSDDGGATWQDWSRGLRTARIDALVADPDDPRRIYAATANGVWTSNEAD